MAVEERRGLEICPLRCDVLLAKVAVVAANCNSGNQIGPTGQSAAAGLVLMIPSQTVVRATASGSAVAAALHPRDPSSVGRIGMEANGVHSQAACRVCWN